MSDKQGAAQELDKALAEQVEPENLDDVDMGINTEAIANIYASERFNLAVAWQRLTIRASAVKASITANKAVGNAKEAEQFETQLKELQTQIAHCLRGIKTIDRAHPGAKAKQIELESAGKLQ